MYTQRLRLSSCALIFAGAILLYVPQTHVYAEEGSTLSVAQQKEKRALFSKLKLLDNMVYKSSRARAIDASGHEQAIKILKSAQNHYDQAKRLLDDNDLVKSEEEIHKGLNQISIAFRLVVDKTNEEQQAKQQYEELVERIKIFRESFSKAVREKGEKVMSLLDVARIDQLSAQGEALAEQNNYKDAIKPLTEAAAMLEQSLSKAREKETVVYALEFETPKDEYDYELQRNQNYALLASMLLATCPPDKVKRIPLIKRLMAKNEELVAESEQFFNEGDIEQAIKTLEKGSQTLVRALRMGGLTL